MGKEIRNLNGIFDKIYFGVDNIGLVKVYNNEVLSIRNYNPEAMDTFKVDLEKISFIASFWLACNKRTQVVRHPPHEVVFHTT